MVYEGKIKCREEIVDFINGFVINRKQYSEYLKTVLIAQAASGNDFAKTMNIYSEIMLGNAKEEKEKEYQETMERLKQISGTYISFKPSGSSLSEVNISF